MLSNSMSQAGISDRVIEKVFYKNVNRILKEII